MESVIRALMAGGTELAAPSACILDTVDAPGGNELFCQVFLSQHVQK